MLTRLFLTWTIITHIGVMEFSAASPVPSPAEILRQTKSEQMLKYLNEAVDPCENFYQFACGNYAKYHPASETRPGTHILVYAKEDMESKISDLITADKADHKDYVVWRKVKDFYSSCRSASSMLPARFAPKLKEIIQEFGEMPVLAGASWQEEKFDWAQTVAKISHKYDTNIIVGFYIFPDLMENVRNRLHFGHQTFGFESSAMIFDDAHEKHRNSYKLKIAATLVGALDIDPEMALHTADEIFKFEISLAKGLGEFSPTQHESIRKHANADALSQMYSYFDLDINKMLEIWLGFKPNTSMTPLIEVSPYYQLNLVNVLSTTPKKVIANYIYYKLISRFPLPEPNNCEEQTISHFSKFLTHKVYHYYNMSQSAQYVQSVFQDLKSRFKMALESQKYNWIDENTRKLAVQKLMTMQLLIESYDNFNFTKEYESINMDPEDYVENLRPLYALAALRSRTKFLNPPKHFIDEKTYDYSPVYSVTDNIIGFPLSNLLPHYLFSSAYPQALNLGIMGFLMGHEILHGFDDEGRKFDINGALYDWWDEKSAKEYESRTNCFIDQYHQYIYEGQKLPKREFQSENIADNGGIRLAYATYLEWYANALNTQHDMDLETLPRMNYSHRQLFFIGMAQSWCSDILKEIRIAAMATDVHMPDGIRVIGALSNFDEFSREFKCPKGSAMNPIEKCQIF